MDSREHSFLHFHSKPQIFVPPKLVRWDHDFNLVVFDLSYPISGVGIGCVKYKKLSTMQVQFVIALVIIRN